MAALLNFASLTTALAVHAIVGPLLFTAIAWHYFRARGARESGSTAIIWTATVMLLDLALIAGAVQHSLAIFKSLVGTWLPFGLILMATWITGKVMSMLPAVQRGVSVEPTAA